MAGVNRGHVRWSMDIDEEGHREYSITFQCECPLGDGPAGAAASSGLPVTGQAWIDSVVSPGQPFNDNDPWAFCTPFTRVTPKITDEGGDQIEWWLVEKRFTTIPITRCQDVTIKNPLLEPQKVSGSFIRGTRKTSIDANFATVLNRSHQPIEFEYPNNLPIVRIEQNVLNLGLDVFTPMVVNAQVNDRAMWGLGTRKVRLANASWERKYYGVCNAYYTRAFEFEINDQTFDLDDVPDKGTKLIAGKWDDSDPPVYVKDTSADPNNPSDFIEARDRYHNPTEYWLGTDGLPVTSLPAERYVDTVAIGTETNFFVLGIPALL